ncbi:MAG: pyrroloquinoline quinone biosynthesis peptide chaperone PqqD [Hyphomicrobiales bacterium]|nr:pyrroloquinoline quinone biosynthesis peptide chaperone PqqD [Hyphomicrobiales bacterium]
MDAARTRAIVDAASRPNMPRHVRLQLNELRDRYVVLAPEKVMWPDPVSVDVLKLCDGSRSIADIAQQLAADYNAPPEVIQTDVMEFVQEWTDKRLLVLS